MHAHRKGFLLKCTLVVGACSMFIVVVISVAKGFRVGDLTSLPQALQRIEREHERSQQLDKSYRIVADAGPQNDGVVAGLIQQRCDLRKAAARLRKLYQPAQLAVIQSRYPQANT